MIKKLAADRTLCSHDPNSQLIATGCCDFKCRVFSAFVSGVDTASEETLFAISLTRS